MGGGAAGKISYPEYISLIHSKMLDSEGTTDPDTDIVTAFNTALLINPFLGVNAVTPDGELTKAYTDLTAFRTLAAALNPVTDYNDAIIAMEAAIDGYMNTDYITSPVPTIGIDDSALADDAEAYAAIQNQLMENTILPPWKAGMLNINAVTSSAFVIGESIIRAMNQQDIAKYTSGVRSQIVAKNAELNADFIKQRQDMITKFNVQRNEYVKALASSVVEALIRKVDVHDRVALEALSYSQLHIASKVDEQDIQLTIEENEAKWEIGLFREVGSFMGTMQGAGTSGGTRRPNRGASIAAGAVTGAVNGALTGAAYGGYGAIIGAVGGAVIGAGAAALQTS